jgi:hypothetical protein
MYKRLKRLEAMMEMMASDGKTPRDSLPPDEYIDALENAPLGREHEIVQAFRDSSEPPQFSQDVRE